MISVNQRMDGGEESWEWKMVSAGQDLQMTVKRQWRVGGRERVGVGGRRVLEQRTLASMMGADLKCRLRSRLSRENKQTDSVLRGEL